MVSLAIDVMGGDHAPRAVVEGVSRALDSLAGIDRLLLVGRQPEVEAELRRVGKLGDARLELVHADEVIGMDEPPAAAIRSKRNASIAVAVDLVKQGRALAVVSAGHTGAAVASTVLKLRTLPGIGAVTSSASLVRPELTVRPDFARAADLGVTSATIAETLRVATVGDYPQELAQLNLSERQVPVMVRLNDAARQDLEMLKRLPVPGARGPVALENVATLEVGSGPSDITRHDRKRNINIEVQLGGLPMGDVEQAIAALPSLQRLPPGIERGALGDAEEFGELAAGFAAAMLTGVLCVYMVLVLLLKDFAQPGTILSSLVLSVPGAVLALFLTGSALSMPSMIGLIMLMGIATKNSILLVDYIIIARREHGLDRAAAILDACRKRARPIVMTTIAMGAGMTPIALGWSGDPGFRSPMAIVVIGGLITSTVLSLLVVPVVYSYVDDGVQWLKTRFVDRTMIKPVAETPLRRE